MAEKAEDVKSKTWAMANKLRGRMDASDYKNYILGFLFYRFLSEKQGKYLVENELFDLEDGQTVELAFQQAYQEQKEELVKDLVGENGYMIEPEYTWERLLEKIENSQLKPSDFQDMFTKFEEYAEKNEDTAKNFKGVFNDMNLGDSRLGTTIPEKAKSLVDIFKLIDSIELYDEKGKDILGEIYEYLIGQFAANAGKKGGEFYTPHQVSQILAGIVTAGREESDQTFEVFDPTCGSGSLLLTVGDALPGGKRQGAVSYYGQEINTTTYNLCRMNLMMHDVDVRNMTLRNADTLGPDWPNGIENGENNPKTNFDAVVANPPYSAHWNNEDSLLKDARFKDYGKLAPKTKADLAFVLDGLYHLDPNGTMAVVMPHGVLFRGNAEETIRKALIEKAQIDAVIGLPANLFYGTGIPTIILVLKKNKKHKDIFFIDAKDHFSKVKAKNELKQEDVDRILEAYKNKKDIDKFARMVPIDEIRNNDYNLNIPRYIDTSEEEEELDLNEIFSELEKIDLQITEIESELEEKFKLLGAKL